MKKVQKPKGGRGSTNIAIAGDINVQGLTYDEVKSIALDVARSELEKFAEKAKRTASDRADEIVNLLLTKVGTQADLSAAVQDPDFQWVLAQAKLSYARSGDVEQKDLLTDLLVERIKLPQRSVRQIAVGEAVGVIGKLTEPDISALGLIFTVRFTIFTPINNDALLSAYLSSRVAIFGAMVPKHDSSYQHLEYAGCGNIGIGSIDLVDAIKSRYFGGFMRPLDKPTIDALANEVGGTKVVNQIFEKRSDTEFFPKPYNTHELDRLAQSLSLKKHEAERLSSVIQSHTLAGEEAKKRLLELSPSMKATVDHWNDSACGHFTLSSVGIAIGHAEVRHRTGDMSNLKIWIPS